MNKTELKKLLLKNFEERLDALVGKIRAAQTELAEDVEKFRAEYGNIGIAALGSLALPLIKPVVTLTSKRNGESSPKKKTRRQRRNSGINITALLKEKVPTVIATFSQDEEFTARDVFNRLVKEKHVPATVKPGHVSLVLGKNAQDLGIKATKRMAGKPIPKPTNFFSLAKRRRVKK